MIATVRWTGGAARCGAWKASHDFHDSRTGQFSYCRDCRRDYDRRYYAERGRHRRLSRQRTRSSAIRTWVADLKRDKPCADCGRIFQTAVMQFDHLPGHQKLAAISTVAVSRKRTLLLEELKKCELVCANCHAIRTARRMTGRSSAR